jgi:hypothetical protein
MTAALAALTLAAAPLQDAKTIALFNGKDLQGWTIDAPELEKSPETPKPFFVRDGLLVTSGRPAGHLISEGSYGNYRLTVEYRYSKGGGNNGILIHCSTPRFFANLFPKSLEVQLMSGNAGDFYTLGEDIETPNQESRKQGRRIVNFTDGSEKPLGEWNTIVTEARWDSVLVWVNGQLVNVGYKCTASEGKIALQSEGAEVEFRKLDLTRL